MDINTINFEKLNGLLPVIVQHYRNLQVLMLGFMNHEALQKTLESQQVTFFSRTKNRLWTKGETSGNYLWVKSVQLDCDKDTLLLKVEPEGNTCHLGTKTCFGNPDSSGFLYELEGIINKRIDEKQPDSYTHQLISKGINKVAQKLGEEAVELVIESKDNNKDLFLNEAADLMYHYLILLKAKGFSLNDVESVLASRNQ
jgi:phosphoribosyl-ATP pyrophosphohydrolase/phosphoribosyl-AMP cyclohydrolase